MCLVDFGCLIGRLGGVWESDGVILGGGRVRGTFFWLRGEGGCERGVGVWGEGGED